MSATALYTRQAAAFRNEMKQTCAALVGITQGILADGELHDREVHFLSDWLAQAENVSLLWPGLVIHAQVKQILADGVITAEVRIPRHRGHRSTLMEGSVPSDRGQQSTRSRAAFQTMAGTIPF